MRRVAAAMLALSMVAACGGSDDDNRVETRKKTTTTRRVTTTTPDTSGTAVTDKVAATKVATLKRPIALAVRPGEPSAVYIAQKDGTVRRLQVTASGATVDLQPVLNIATKVSTGSEQGLLSITFSADGNWLYASYTNTDGDTRVVVFPFSNGRADEADERVILAVDQPYPNHNGGQVNHGPDGLLYIALGDGGSGGDPQDNAENLGSLLGKILRVAPNPAGGYSVPGDNPFVGQRGKRGEIWHYGLRNPWRWSFDRANGEQWIADVGQNDYEEINHVGAGAKGVDFGWNRREAKHAFNGGTRPAGAVDPEYELAHSAGNCSITGGYVYRGTTIRGFAGTYVFADFCRGQISAASGGTLRELGLRVESVSSLGEDANGELWVLSLAGGVYRLTRA